MTIGRYRVSAMSYIEEILHGQKLKKKQRISQHTGLITHTEFSKRMKSSNHCSHDDDETSFVLKSIELN